MLHKNSSRAFGSALTISQIALCMVVLASQLAAQTWQIAGPAPRAAHSAVLDTATNSMLVFGGTIPNENANSRTNLNDVWRLNGNLTWTVLKPIGTPPAPRSLHSAIYDSANNRMVIFGGGEGNTSPCANDVWVLTNANGKTGTPEWVELAPTGTAPAPRANHGAVYDPNTNSMILYGGQNCFSTIFGDVWLLSNANGLGGTPAWTQLFPTGSGPGARFITGGVAYDSAHNRLIVFGGFDGADHNDTWVLSNANGQGGTPTWAQLAPSGTFPSARDSNITVYDATNNRLTLFGGENSGGILQDAWVLTNANGLGNTPVWTQLGPFPLLPAGRFYHSGVYNPKKNKITIFGGVAFYDGVHSIGADDVWVLDHANGK
jgi:Galactose oxidase, central domain